MTTQSVATPTLEQWWASGTHVTVTLDDPEHPGKTVSRRLFAHVEGRGPWLTLLHGFPSSSWDWSRVIPLLTDHFQVLTFDLLGYGNSDKPAKHAYRTREHVDSLFAVWAHLGIVESSIVGHDIGGSMLKELLARQLEGTNSAKLCNAVFLNSAVYTDHYTPVLLTRLMRNPIIGPFIVGRLTEASLSKSIARIFSRAHPASPQDLRETWHALSYRDGIRNIPQLLHYIPESKSQHARWNHAVQNSRVPMRFIWGMDDPATGRHIAQDIRRYKPGDPFVGYEDVGHFPQLEVPERVAAELLKLA